MVSLSVLRESIGPVWPLMVGVAAFMAATTLLCIILFGLPVARRRNEVDFLRLLRNAVDTFASLAVLAGMAGTCYGLSKVLPALRLHLDGGATDMAPVTEMLKALQNVFLSTLAGLVIGGMWGAINELMLLVLIGPAENGGSRKTGELLRRLSTAWRRRRPRRRRRQTRQDSALSFRPEVEDPTN